MLESKKQKGRDPHPAPLLFSIILLLCVLMAACDPALAGSATPTFTPLQQRGQSLFRRTCGPCHSTIPGTVIVGPSLAGIADRADDRVPGLDARAYILQSIREPQAYVVEGFPKKGMPVDLAEQLSPEDIDAIVAYVLTLGE